MATEPSSDLILSCFEELKNHLSQLCQQKISDNNNWKATSKEGHEHLIPLPNYHRLLFNSLFTVKSLPEEIITRNKLEIVLNLERIHRLQTVLSDVLLARCHSNGDISVVSPWGYLKMDVHVTGSSPPGGGGDDDMMMMMMILTLPNLMLSL